MAEPESIIVAHYEAIRSEIMERIRLRDQYIVWFVTLSAAAVGVYTSNEKWWGLITGVPVLACLAGLTYGHTDVTLGTLGQWLRSGYFATLEGYRTANSLTYPLEFWDHSPAYKRYASGTTFALRYISVALVVAAVGITSCTLVSEHLEHSIPKWDGIVKFALWTLVVVGAAGPLWAWRERVKNA